MADLEVARSWPRVGGHLALDFVDTRGGLPETRSEDALSGYDQLLAWSRSAGLLTAEQERRLSRAGARSPDAAAAALERVLRLRDVAYGLLDDVRSGARRPEGWGALRPFVVEATQAVEPVVAPTGRVTWTWGFDDLADPLHPLAFAVVDLLVGPDLASLRRCDRCDWLFLDRSRNHSRRWCRRETCGLAVKLERQTARRRAGRPTS